MTSPSPSAGAVAGRSPTRALLALALALAALGLPWLLAEQGYLLRIACLILLFASLAQAWNIAAGLSGLTSLGHAGFFGTGAYVSTILLVRFGWSPWLGLLCAALAGALLAALLCLPTIRLRGHYFVLAPLAFV